MGSGNGAAVKRDSGRAPGGADESPDGGSDVSAIAPRTSQQQRSAAPRREEPESAGSWLTRELSPGRVINSKYRVESVLGRGAMGVVVACEHLELRERVALKFLLKTGETAGDNFAARFLQEAQVSAKLKNQHITRVVDVGVWGDDAPFMVMEHLEGRDLREVMRQEGRVPIDQAVNYVVQLCEGLAEAHGRGIVHRDLKPSNIFVVRDLDGSDLVKILDFGISKLTSNALSEGGDKTETGFVLGSPKYMSPEQLFDSNLVGPHSDVWALGVILYEMLMGRPPFEAPTIAQAIAWLSADKMPASLCAEIPDLPPAVEAVIFRCFARKAAERTPNVAMLAGELLDAVGSPNADSVCATLDAILTPHAPREGATWVGSGPDENSSRSGRGGGRASSSQRRVPVRRTKTAAVIAVGMAVALACAGAGVWWTHRAAARAAATRPVAAPVPSVHVVVTVAPREATIEIDGQDRGTGPLSFDVASDARDHAIRVSARGYALQQRSVQFSRDVQLDIALDRLGPAPTSSAAGAPSAVAPPVSTPVRTAVPRFVAPARTAAASSPAASESQCTPPYYFANGIKTFKPECL